MKIVNELVSLKIGKKQYDFNNLILDEYLRRFAKSQLNKEEINRLDIDKALRYCLIKFDTPIENIRKDIDIHNQDFDICFVDGANSVQIINEEQISIQYNYETNKSVTNGNVTIWDYEKDTANGIYLRSYYNRKITAIGFNSYWINDENSTYKLPVCAILDTSNYNIYLQENQDFSVTRKDIITTDGIFYSNSKEKVSAPAHLCPNGLQQIINQPNIYQDESQMSWYSFNDFGYGILYSIGLSSYPDYIDKEFIIGKDIEATLNETEININGLENYLSTDSPLFCSNELYANTKLYPIRTNYKYVIFKYKVWQIVHSGTYNNVISTPTDTGYYYYQAIPIGKFGKSNLKIKYERG